MSIEQLRTLYGESSDKVFRSITGDNGSTFASLLPPQALPGTFIDHTYPYASYERGPNNRHTHRRSFFKGRSSVSPDAVQHVQAWVNPLPCKPFLYVSPAQLFLPGPFNIAI